MPPALALSAPAAVAPTTGEIQGNIHSADGQPLADVSVTLFQAGKTETAQQVSDAEGNFRFSELVRGVYVASASLEDFGPVTCPGVSSSVPSRASSG